MGATTATATSRTDKKACGGPLRAAGESNSSPIQQCVLTGRGGSGRRQAGGVLELRHLMRLLVTPFGTVSGIPSPPLLCLCCSLSLAVLLAEMPVFALSSKTPEPV